MSAKEKRLQLQTSRPKKFRFEYLESITQRFAQEQIIGRGGFGTVYKGKKDNGEFIAVKMLNQTEIAQIDDAQFKKEVLNVMYISHPNIVRLEGYCINKDEELITHEGELLFAEKQNRLICFEYVPNGSLQAYLNNEDKCRVPNWNERYNIIKGICKGLHYLHEGRDGEYILHLDLKPANILLDKNMIPKIADFGQSRLRLLNAGQTHTSKLVGTWGYMAPEHIKRGALVPSKETDVYSVGVIIMEIIAGERKYPADQLDEVREKWKETTSREEYEQIENCIELALRCMEEEPKERVDMKQVIEILGISEDDMNHHPDGIGEHCRIGNSPEPLLEERHGLLRRYTMTADKRNSQLAAATVRTRLLRVMNSEFLCGVPIIIPIILGLCLLMHGLCLLMHLVLAYIVPPNEMSQTIYIEVHASTSFTLVTSSSSAVLTYHLVAVMIATDNPSSFKPWFIDTKKPIDVVFFFGGHGFNVTRPRIYTLATQELVSLGPQSGDVTVDTAGVAVYRTETSMGLYEVELLLAGQVMFSRTFTVCNVQATCPFKLLLAPTDGTTELELLQKVKCPVYKNCTSYQ